MKTERAKKIMRYIGWAILAFFVLIATRVTVLPGVTPVRPEIKKMPLEVNVAVVHEAWLQGATILDVRSLSELQAWGAGHIKGATLIPLEQLTSRIEELPRNGSIYVVCTSGQKSAIGRDTLLAAGFDLVTSMTGGMDQWEKSGYEVVPRP